jgi:hypothetical protein
MQRRALNKPKKPRIPKKKAFYSGVGEYLCCIAIEFGALVER